MRLETVTLHWVRLPLVTPFRTAYGVERDREALLVRVVTEDGVEGWGECVAMPEPQYCSEYLDGAAEVLRRFLIPAVARLSDGEDTAPAGGTAVGRPPADALGVTAAAVERVLAAYTGHPMAKAALHTAILDARLRTVGMSLGEYLGATRNRVPAGVSVGIMDTVDELVEAVARYRDAGYRRIKLKIEPGWDIEPVRAVRECLGDEFPLQVDANCSYGPTDARHLARLDEFGLLLIEQPLPETDLLGHAALARTIRTPICLDEPIVSAADAHAAITLGATSIVNIKPGRVGGYAEARRIHDVCAAHGVPVWVGGMVETGIGRAPNIALAALPNCALVGDLSPSNRFFARDITPEIAMVDGWIEVPTAPGIGIDPDPKALEEATTRVVPCHGTKAG